MYLNRLGGEQDYPVEPFLRLRLERFGHGRVHIDRRRERRLQGWRWFVCLLSMERTDEGNRTYLFGLVTRRWQNIVILGCSGSSRSGKRWKWCSGVYTQFFARSEDPAPRSWGVRRRSAQDLEMPEAGELPNTPYIAKKEKKGVALAKILQLNK